MSARVALVPDSSSAPAAAPGPGLTQVAALPRDFEDVYTEEFGFVWRSLRSLGVVPSALDDAAQDVFLVVHRRLAEFEERSSIRTWLFSIVEHVAFNYRRAQRRKVAPLEPLDLAQPSEAPGPDEQAADSQAARFLERFLDTLDAGKRAVFALALVEQMPAPEVAEALGIPINTVYSRVRAVRQALQEAAAAHQETET